MTFASPFYSGEMSALTPIHDRPSARADNLAARACNALSSGDTFFSPPFLLPKEPRQVNKQSAQPPFDIKSQGLCSTTSEFDLQRRGKIVCWPWNTNVIHQSRDLWTLCGMIASGGSLGGARCAGGVGNIFSHVNTQRRLVKSDPPRRGHATTCQHRGRPLEGGSLQINCRLAHFEVRGIRQRRVPINHKGVVFGLDVIAMERKGP